MPAEPENNDKILAATEFIRRTGAAQVQMRYSDDEYPVIWLAIAVYNGENPTKIVGVEVDASTSQTRAILRLCERLADGGQCLHCKKPMGLEPDMLWRMPFDDKICWWQYDPELKTFRRGCE